MAYKDIMYIELYADNKDRPNFNYVADIHLPANRHTIEDALQRCREYLASSVMTPLSIESCNEIPLLAELRLDTTTLYELNFLATRIAQFDAAELAEYKALLPLIAKEEDINSVKDLINLTYCVNDYMIASNIHDDEDLGELLIEGENVAGIENMDEATIELLDRAKIGRIERENNDGVFVDGYYVARSGFELKEVYDGKHLPEESDDYIFRFELYNGIDEARIVSFPLSEEDREFVEKSDLYVWLKFESGIPQIKDVLPSSSDYVYKEDILRIDKIAQQFAKMEDMMAAIYIKAAFEAEEIETFADLDKMEDIMHNPYAKILRSANMFANDMAKDYLLKFIKPDFPKEYVELINTDRLSDKLMQNWGGKYTSYGILLDREMMMQHEQIAESKYQVANAAGRTVLFTNDRIAAKDVPEGLFKYELRSGGGYEYASLENEVGVDFAGTVLSKEPFVIADSDYIDLLKYSENGIDFYDGQLTPSEYLQPDDSGESEINEDEGMGMNL